jgi:outer membrane receptor protein involved in Fe transport
MRLCACALLATLAAAKFGPVARAQSAATAASVADLAKYDTNHNGQLDPNEIAVRDADRARAAAAVQPATPSTSNNPDDVIELSPFQVTAEDSTGYYASNTLSGTRMNSKIEDLAASITVVTKQQLDDTAAVDINDIFLYEANTEGTGQYTAFTFDSQNRVFDDVQENPTTANRIRGVAAANTARGNFATNSRIPIDTYNVESVEISRGPNSNLFGLGEASGTVNINTAKANLTRETSQLQLRADDWGSKRASLDINRPIIKDKLAVRLSAVYDDRAFTRKPSYDTTQRQQAAITYQPFKSTTLRGSYESYHQRMRRPNSQTPRDMVSQWRDSGQPTWDPVTFRYKLNGVYSAPVPAGGENSILPRGLGLDTTQYTRPSMYIDNGQVVLWTPNRLSAGSNPNSLGGSQATNYRIMTTYTDFVKDRFTYSLFVTPGVSDKSLYDWENINFTATNWQRNKADIYSVELEQRFLQTPSQRLYGQFGWYMEDTDNYNVNLVRETSFLYVDINERLLDGRPNPNFMRPYVTVWEPTLNDRPEINDNVRGSLAYEINFTRRENWLKHLGLHRILGYREVRKITSESRSMREYVLDDNPWTNPANRTSPAAGRASYRYYLGDNQGFNVEYGPPQAKVNGTFDFYYRNNPALYDPENNPGAGWTTETSVFGQAPSGSPRINRREVRSSGAAMQSFFWKDRIVTTLGIRKDVQRNRSTNNLPIDPTTGFYPYDPSNVYNDWLYRDGKTKTYGIVFKATPWLSFHYNGSDSFTPANVTKNILGETLPNPSGEGKDYGFSVNLWDNKLVGRVNWYETTAFNNRASGAANTAVGRLRNIETAFEDLAETTADLNLGGDGDNATPPSYTDAEFQAEKYRIMGLPLGYMEQFNGFSVSESADVISKGLEIELNYNPSRNLSVKLTAAKQETIDANVSDASQEYIAMRLPHWTAAIDPISGESWWETSNRGRSWFEGQFGATYELGRANIGKPRTQVRKWRANLTSRYRFADREGWLKNLSVGGAARWEDRAAIGFLGDIDPALGRVTSLDPNRPVWDKARAYFDLWGSYDLRLFSGRVRTKLQLNVRNVFENGRLQAITVNPDGQPSSFRIIDPRQFILTATFDL